MIHSTRSKSQFFSDRPSTILRVSHIRSTTPERSLLFPQTALCMVSSTSTLFLARRMEMRKWTKTSWVMTHKTCSTSLSTSRSKSPVSLIYQRTSARTFTVSMNSTWTRPSTPLQSATERTRLPNSITVASTTWTPWPKCWLTTCCRTRWRSRSMVTRTWRRSNTASLAQHLCLPWSHHLFHLVKTTWWILIHSLEWRVATRTPARNQEESLEDLLEVESDWNILSKYHSSI